MRNIFRHNAQRDVLRAKKPNDHQPTPKSPKTRKVLRLPAHNQLLTAFLLAALGNEATHVSEHHNPHGNRRERIEEMRVRALEAERSPMRLRNINGGNGGGPEPSSPVEIVAREAASRRRVPVDMDQPQV
jgi:hypothetical protein